MPTAHPLQRPLHARSRLPAGDHASALLTVRPSAVRLCATDRGEHHMVGTVTDVAFRGRGYEHAVDLAGGTRITGIYARRRTGSGEAVGLRFLTEGCLVFPA
jgi:iron(III) transport system ATP-binding protein